MTCPGCGEAGIRGYCAQCVADRKRGELPAPDLSPSDPLTPEPNSPLLIDAAFVGGPFVALVGFVLWGDCHYILGAGCGLLFVGCLLYVYRAG